MLELFESAIAVFHHPRRIRTDYGTENVDVARRMLDRYGPESSPVLTGQSVHNQRIERLWRDVHNYIVMYFKNIFYYLESSHLLDPDDDIDIFALHYIYIYQGLTEQLTSLFYSGITTPFLLKGEKHLCRSGQRDFITLQSLISQLSERC